MYIILGSFFRDGNWIIIVNIYSDNECVYMHVWVTEFKCKFCAGGCQWKQKVRLLILLAMDRWGVESSLNSFFLSFCVCFLTHNPMSDNPPVWKGRCQSPISLYSHWRRARQNQIKRAQPPQSRRTSRDSNRVVFRQVSQSVEVRLPAAGPQSQKQIKKVNTSCTKTPEVASQQDRVEPCFVLFCLWKDQFKVKEGGKMLDLHQHQTL